jgi:integrase
MFLPIKAICNRRPRKDGTCVISIQFCFSSERRTLLFTGLAVPPEYWNKKTSRIHKTLPPEFGHAENMNMQLQRMMRAAEDIIYHAIEKKMPDPLTHLKQVFHPEITPENLANLTINSTSHKIKDLDFFSHMDDYIKSKIRKVSVGMIRSYMVMKKRLLAFEKHQNKKITFDSFDYNFYETFVNYLTYEHLHMRRGINIRGLKTNSVGTSIKQLRIFLRDRIRRKMINDIDLSDFKILEEEADTIYLNKKEIHAIYSLELTSHPEWARFRDMFVLGCLTGLRFSDFNQIKPDDIRNGVIYKKQSKSDKWVVIPLRSEAHDILINRFRKIVPKTTNAELNRYIKKVGQLAGIDSPVKISCKKGNQDIITVKPKFSLITTHTCRRSFCTNEFMAGTPPELIMKISGHKSTKDFYKYIRISSEEAGQKIKEIWESRGEMRY